MISMKLVRFCIATIIVISIALSAWHAYVKLVYISNHPAADYNHTSGGEGISIYNIFLAKHGAKLYINPDLEPWRASLYGPAFYHTYSLIASMADPDTINHVRVCRLITFVLFVAISLAIFLVSAHRKAFNRAGLLITALPVVLYCSQLTYTSWWCLLVRPDCVSAISSTLASIIYIRYLSDATKNTTMTLQFIVATIIGLLFAFALGFKQSAFQLMCGIVFYELYLRRIHLAGIIVLPSVLLYLTSYFVYKDEFIQNTVTASRTAQYSWMLTITNIVVHMIKTAPLYIVLLGLWLWYRTPLLSMIDVILLIVSSVLAALSTARQGGGFNYYFEHSYFFYAIIFYRMLRMEDHVFSRYNLTWERCVFMTIFVIAAHTAAIDISKHFTPLAGHVVPPIKISSEEAAYVRRLVSDGQKCYIFDDLVSLPSSMSTVPTYTMSDDIYYRVTGSYYKSIKGLIGERYFDVLVLQSNHTDFHPEAVAAGYSILEKTANFTIYVKARE